MVKSFQKERRVRYESPESSYWGGTYKGWAKWKNELPKTYKSVSKPKQNKSETEDKTTPTLKQMSFAFGD